MVIDFHCNFQSLTYAQDKTRTAERPGKYPENIPEFT